MSRNKPAKVLTDMRQLSGKSAVKALQTPAYAKQKGVPKIASEDEALSLLRSIIPHAFYLKVDRGQSVTSTGPGGAKGPSIKMLQVNQMQAFNTEDYYVWLLEGSQFKSVLGGIGLVAVILAGVMFPLWPNSLRVGVWYLSMAMLGVIGLFFGLAIFRLIFYVITIVVAKPGIWIFPNLFADVGFVRPAVLDQALAVLTKLLLQIDSFIPGWDWDLPPPKKKKVSKLFLSDQIELIY
jgi:translocation protein SEC62